MLVEPVKEVEGGASRMGGVLIKKMNVAWLWKKWVNELARE